MLPNIPRIFHLSLVFKSSVGNLMIIRKTALHLFKYYNIFVHNRILWAILCLGSFVLMVNLILPICHKYNDFPTVTTVIETNYPVYKVDFPAVTICSNNKVIEKSLDRALTSAYKDPNAT